MFTDRFREYLKIKGVARIFDELRRLTFVVYTAANFDNFDTRAIEQLWPSAVAVVTVGTAIAAIAAFTCIYFYFLSPPYALLRFFYRISKDIVIKEHNNKTLVTYLRRSIKQACYSSFAHFGRPLLLV